MATSNPGSFIPNPEQKECILKITDFLITHKQFSKLLVNGSAGTGKTTILISSIIDFIGMQIMERYDHYKMAIQTGTWDLLKNIKDFIIAAPTNKAKDVLIDKYNTYLNTMNSDLVIDRLVLNEIVHRKITFLTVSQVLSISRVINEMGEEEFTKGNEKKIADKFKLPNYDNTVIIIDECSMLDSNITKLLNVIRCPIIYIGDICQLPPVNEILSPVFQMVEDGNTMIIRLNKVERCKDNITKIANILRDKIYGHIHEFNLLKQDASLDMKLYPKKQDEWLDTYVKDIQEKLKYITNTTPTTPTTQLQSDSNAVTSKNDSMVLAWTNKCCSSLNEEIRNKLFIANMESEMDSMTDEEIDTRIDMLHTSFLVKGDKLLVKAPYYKYSNRIYSSSILYVSKLEKIVYKPLDFKEWSNLLADKKKPNQPININDILDTVSSSSKPKKNTPTKNIADYFNMISHHNEQRDNIDANPEISENELAAREIEKYRQTFFQHHNLYDIITAGIYIFNDEIATKYANIIPDMDIHTIKTMDDLQTRADAYTKWHKAVSKVLFGIPIDKVYCKKCQFFFTKFESQLDKSCYIADFINATETLCFNMYLAELVQFTSRSQVVLKDIPILDMNDKVNMECIEKIRNIVRNSYEVKMQLTRQDESVLRGINKMMGEDDNDALAASGPRVPKYITMSQMLGHYFNHIISSNYLEVDYGYALTVHKSQGSTYNDVYVEYNNLQANRKDTEKYKLLYTAITRTANNLHVYY
jgi:SepF-like predicted cell division protein (DUF552 family)